ncbi:MAG: hypothetical protein Q9208_005150 [Pyrenodesmia sp. 3 TL-2023]
MSSRLLTMKFMQRAAASSPPSTPQELDGPRSAKRRKTSADQSSVTTPITIPVNDAHAFQVAADAEDAKRAAAIEKVAADAGETKWVLSTADTDGSQANGIGQRKLRFLATGYSDIDADPAQTTERRAEMGRRSFGRFSENIKEQQYSDTTSDTSSSFSSDFEREHGDTYSEDEDTDGDGTGHPEILLKQPGREEALQRKVDRKAKKKAAEKAEAACLVEHRRSKEVKLNRLSSISGGGGIGGVAGIECHFCGQKGHRKADCPRKAKSKGRREVG